MVAIKSYKELNQVILATLKDDGGELMAREVFSKIQSRFDMKTMNINSRKIGTRLSIPSFMENHVASRKDSHGRKYYWYID